MVSHCPVSIVQIHILNGHIASRFTQYHFLASNKIRWISTELPPITLFSKNKVFEINTTKYYRLFLYERLLINVHFKISPIFRIKFISIFFGTLADSYKDSILHGLNVLQPSFSFTSYISLLYSNIKNELRL